MMGMFDNTFNVGDIPMETAQGYGNTNAFMIGAMQGTEGMVAGLGRLAGFQTEDDMLREIYENADFDTEEGINEMIQKVMAINPEAGAALQKQVTERSIASAQYETANLATESAKLQNVMIKHGTRLNREFTMTPDDGGQKTTIGQFMIKNGIDTEDYHPSTFAQAMKVFIQEYPEDSKMVTVLKDSLKDELALARDLWVKAGAMAIVEGDKAPDTYSAEQTFSADLLSDDADWQAFLKFKESQKPNNKISQTAAAHSVASSYGMGAR
jgi:hypothetical protein